MSIYIELFGLPASGKTTLLDTLGELSQLDGLKLTVPLTRAPVTSREKWRKFNRDLRSITRLQLTKFNLSYEIWHACQLFKQPTAALQLRMYLNCLRLESLVQQCRQTASRNEIIAFDQGLFQAIWSLALQGDVRDRHILREKAALVVKVMTLPNLVIFVDTPLQVSCQRLTREPFWHGRLVTLMKEDPSCITRAWSHVQILWALMSEVPGVSTFRWDPDKVEAWELLDFIKRFWYANGEVR